MSGNRGRGRGGRGRFSQYKSAPYPGYAPGAGINFAEDSISFGLRGQYTNFEQRARVKREKEAGQRQQSEWAKVLRPIPEGLKTKIVVVNPEEVVCFHGRTHFLSNFHKARIVVDGNVYPSVEHYYQACKLYMLAGPYHSSQIRRMPDPGSVKVAARRILYGAGVPEEDIDEWKINEGPRILEYGMMHKFVQNSELRSQLLGTGNALLVHAFPNDKVFAAGMEEEKFMAWAKENKDLNLAVPVQLSPETIPYFPKFGDGKNLEGLVCMRIRDEIRKFSGDIEKRQQVAEAKKKEAQQKKEAGDKEETETSVEKVEVKAEDDVINEEMDAGLVAAMASLVLSVKLPPPRPKPTGPFYKSREEGHVPQSGKENSKNGANRFSKPRNLEEGATPKPTGTEEKPDATPVDETSEPETKPVKIEAKSKKGSKKK